MTTRLNRPPARHREQHTMASPRTVSVAETIDEYLARADWRVNANANQGYSLGGMILNAAGKLIANYWLDEVYAPEAGTAHREGDLHIHDLDVFAGYCAGWSLRMVLEQGFNGVPGKIASAPPKHFSSALGQLVNFLGTLQNEWAGAQAFSSFDTYLAPFVRLDALTYPQVRQAMQEFVFNLNVPSRWGTQTPFTNLTFDWVCPDDLADQHPLIGGEVQPFTYGDLADEMALINRAFIDVLTEGDQDGRAFTFPIPTYNITEDFDWHGPHTDALFAMTAKYGLPYFQNFVNSDLDPHMIRSMCCRLQLDLTELLKRGNGLFGSAEQTGSIGVATINCARIGFVHSADEDAALARLDELLEIARDSLVAKRATIARHLDGGLFPYTQRYLGTIDNHFSTIGVNGINEYVRNLTRGADDITTEAGMALAARLLDHVRARMVEFQEESGHLFNLEATPAEGTTYRFAKEDIARLPGIRHAGTDDNPYYTNSSQLPVGYTADPFLAMALQEPLQQKYTGGTVLHLYMGEAMPSAEACRELVRRSLSRFRLPYITVTPTFSICPAHGYRSGHHEQCPDCGAACEVWTRVMGYFRPIESFNIGKKGEAQERTYFSTAIPGDPGDSSGSGDSTDSGDSVREEAPWHGSPQPVS
ncbi:ribonucleoside triphosphate reductase [Microbacterium lacticum]|uniref:ribonucleoside triphosphate reductase n=1 Tax=Microbacterium lacticum TaxID=33885 RepID=UPI0028BE50A5|nr:ribonucleoside triphosphate reductase [Microbacterium lacticum]